jgi:hypothetical protein
MLKELVRRWTLAARRRKYRVGVCISRFLAPDVRRDIEVVDASEIELGFVGVRTRTWNVLHASKGGLPPPAFSDTQRIALERLWAWDGARWGGPVPPEKSNA